MVGRRRGRGRRSSSRAITGHTGIAAAGAIEKTGIILIFECYDDFAPFEPHWDFSEDYSRIFAHSPRDSRFPPPTQTAKKIVLLHTGRCGSTLLHHLIKKEGVICPPFEMFNPESVADIIDKMDVQMPVPFGDFLQRYREDTLKEHIDTPSAVLSVSITPWRLRGLHKVAPELVSWLFEGADVYVLLRRDILWQAISYQRASKSGVWHVFDESTRRNAAAIDADNFSARLESVKEYIDLIVWGERSMAAEPIASLLAQARSLAVSTYEAFIANQQSLVDHMTQTVGHSPSSKINEDDPSIPKEQLKNIVLYERILTEFPLQLPSGITVDRNFLGRRLQGVPYSHCARQEDSEAQVVDIETRYGLVRGFRDDLICEFLRAYGEWSFFETLLINSVIPERSSIFDIGAFLGTFSMSMRTPRFILAVDANPLVAPLLTENLRRNLNSAHAVVSGAVGNMTTTFGEYTDKQNFGSFRICAKAQAAASSTEIPAHSLAALREKFGDYDVLKIDIEGSEVDLLKSDAEWIKQHKPFIWAECNEDPRSLTLLEVLLDFGMEIYYFCYPCFNPENFNANAKRIFPVAFEGGLLAVPPGTTVTCPPVAAEAGARLSRMHSTNDLRVALWETPRWAEDEWKDMPASALIALCGRITLGQRFSDFLGGGALALKNLHSALEIRKSTVVSGYANDIADASRDWLLEDVSRLSANELMRGALALDASIRRDDHDEGVLLNSYRKLALLLRTWKAKGTSRSPWIATFHQRVLIQGDQTVQRMAVQAKEAGDLSTAINYFETCAELLANLFRFYPAQTDTLKQRKINNEIELALVHGALADVLVDTERTESAIENFQSCFSLLQQVLSSSTDCEAWVLENFDKYAVKFALLLDRLVHSSLASKKDELVTAYGARAIHIFEQHAALKCDRPKWVDDYYHASLRECGAALKRLGDHAMTAKDDTRAVTMWKCSAALLERLLNTAPRQRAWVDQFRERALLEAGMAYDRLSEHATVTGNRLGEINASRNAVQTLRKLLASYPNQPRWVVDYYEKHVRRGAASGRKSK